MKAIQKKFYSKAAVLQMATFVLIASCQKDESILSSTDVQNVNAEAASSAFISENLDITTKTMAGLTTAQYAGSRIETDTLSSISLKDDRLTCALVTIDRTGTKDAPAGTITIDYGDGTRNGVTCTDSRGVQRKGKIIINYVGQRWVNGLTFEIALKEYYRNAMHIEGKERVTLQLVTDSLQFKFISILDSAKVTFVDGKTIQRWDSLSRTLYRFVNPETNLINPAKDEWHSTGLAVGKNSGGTGTNKNGDQYIIQITQPLVNKVSCLIGSRVIIPVAGNKKIYVDGKTYYIDYGNGTCDNLITVSFNGGEKTISVNNDGN